jgi:hypothetical protein
LGGYLIVCTLRRDGNRRKGEMKNKIVATLVVLSLFLGMFATLNMGLNTAQGDIKYHLDVYTKPVAIPINGTGDYTDGTYVQLDALDYYIVGNIKYVFDYWDIDNVYWGTLNPLQWVLMTANHNSTAHYKTQYKVTLNPNPFTAQGVTDWIWSAPTGWVNTNTMWVDANTNAEVGVEGLWSAPPGVYVNPNVWAYLVNFTGDATGYTDWGWIWTSDPFNVTGPKAASSQWAFMYLLNVISNTNPPPDPAGTGWYYAGTVVTLNAPDYSLNFAVYRYTLTTWKVDGSTVPGNPINVTMNTNHTAIAFYKRQSFVYLLDNQGNASGLADTGKWYDDGVNYVFTAPTPLPTGPGIRLVFGYWDKPGYGWTNSSNPLTIAFDASWDGEKLRAKYGTQYYMLLASKPSGISGYLYPDSNVTGWYDYNAVIYLRARTIVQINATTRYTFIQWKNHLAGVDPNANTTFNILQPWNITAEYNLEYLATWKHSPTSITVVGSPGQAWIASGTDVWYGLPAWDSTTQYQFYYWVINGVTYPQAVNPAHVGICTGPIDGTAYYANITKIFMDPQMTSKQASAYCQRFNITVYAANFDANRIVGGQPMDLYAFDMKILWPQALLEVTNVYLNLADFFAPNAYFIAANNIATANADGYFELAASVKGNYTGFAGTKAIFKLEFHVIYDACYPNAPSGGIYYTDVTFQNHLNQYIWPESYVGANYYMTTVKPIIEVRNAVDHSQLVKVDMNVPQQFFNVEVYLHDGVKVKDFWVFITFNKLHINAVSVAIATYLQAPYITYSWIIDNIAGTVTVAVEQDPSVPLQNGSGLLFTINFKVVNQIYYTIPGPWVLSSVIAVNYASLSTKCPLDYEQNTIDGTLGVTDCNYVYNPLEGDLNFDGKVDVLDLQLIANRWNMAPPYDIFGDGLCALNDLVFVALRFGNHI